MFVSMKSSGEADLALRFFLPVAAARGVIAWGPAAVVRVLLGSYVFMKVSKHCVQT
jgi:hypothetical protein